MTFAATLKTETLTANEATEVSAKKAVKPVVAKRPQDGVSSIEQS
jgi:hypothetical protein